MDLPRLFSQQGLTAPTSSSNEVCPSSLLLPSPILGWFPLSQVMLVGKISPQGCYHPIASRDPTQPKPQYAVATHVPHRSRASAWAPYLSPLFMDNEPSPPCLPRPLQLPHFFSRCPTSFGAPKGKKKMGWTPPLAFSFKTPLTQTHNCYFFLIDFHLLRWRLALSLTFFASEYIFYG